MIESKFSKVKNEPKQFEIPEEGLSQVQVLDVSFEEQVQTKWGRKNRITFALGILNEENRGLNLRYYTSDSFTAYKDGSKLYNLACAIVGEKLDENNEFDINSLVNGTCQVLVKHATSDETGITYANVKEVLAVKKGEALPSLTEEEKGSEHINPNEDIKPSEVLIPED